MSAHPLRRLVRQAAATLGVSATLLAGLVAVAPVSTAAPAAIVPAAGCTASSLPANDDSYSSELALPLDLNFFGTTYESLFVNNNGNVTFGAGMSTYVPFEITGSTPPIFALFLSDVDTSNGGTVSWGQTVYNGRTAFCVNWTDVGYYPSSNDRTNTFQLLLVDRSDLEPGDFDAVYNYGRIQWDLNAAGAGFSAGPSSPDNFYDMPGSRVAGAFLDGGPNSLAAGTRGSATAGRFVFEFRGGRAVGITPPQTSITTGPSGPTSATTAAFTYAAAPTTGSSFECRITSGSSGSGAYTTCPSSGWSSSVLADGTYTFDVRATDSYAVTDPTPASRTFVVDTATPGTTVSSGRTGSSSATSAAFTYGAPGGDAGTATFRCRLTRTGSAPAAFASCARPSTSYTGLADGDYTFEVVSVDQAGNVDPTPETRSFTVDTAAPTGVGFVGGPQGPVGSRDVTFTWDAPAGQGPLTWECRIVGPDGVVPTWTSCDGAGTTFTGLADGDYRVETRATDAAGNVSTATARSFSVDTVAPPSTVTGGTTGTVKGSTVSFTYATDDAAPGTTFECRLVGPGQSDAFAPCPVGGAGYTGLADGGYTFEVRAVDAAGNRGSVQQTAFRVNVLLPTVTATVTSAGRASANGWYTRPVRVVFACDAAGSTLAKACPAPKRIARGSTERPLTRTIRTADGDVATVAVAVSVDRFAPWNLRAKGLDRTRAYHAVPKGLRCRATDRRSGVDSCRLRAHVSKDRRWLLVRLKATDEAGNTRTKVLRAPFRGRG